MLRQLHPWALTIVNHRRRRVTEVKEQLRRRSMRCGGRAAARGRAAGRFVYGRASPAPSRRARRSHTPHHATRVTRDTSRRAFVRRDATWSA